MRRKTRRRLAQALLSPAIAILLVLVVVMPNSNSVIGRMVPHFFQKLSHTLVISYPWTFFSPDPSAVVYWEYSVEINESKFKGTDEDLVDIEMKTFRWPPKNPRTMYRVPYNRKIYHSRMSSLNEAQFRRFFIPHLCKLHPEADALFIKAVVKGHPDMEAPMTQADVDAASKKILENYPNLRFGCKETLVGDHLNEDEPGDI